MGKKILILGASGMLGKRLSRYLADSGMDIATHGYRGDAEYLYDLTDSDKARELFENLDAGVVINLVALTNVDQCEADPGYAYELNVAVTENVIQNIGEDTRLIHLSTDQLYNGAGPHKEDSHYPSNVYGLTKYCSEKIVEQHPKSVVLRTNFFGKSITPGRSSFSDWIYESVNSGQDITLFRDVYFNPLSINTLSDMIRRVILNPKPGVYNLGSRKGMSKRKFALNMASVLDLNLENAREGSVEDLDLTAFRPKDMRMDVSKFETTYSVTLPTLEEEILTLKNYYDEA